MADINLLPEELRSREARVVGSNRSTRQPVRLVVPSSISSEPTRGLLARFSSWFKLRRKPAQEKPMVAPMSSVVKVNSAPAAVKSPIVVAPLPPSLPPAVAEKKVPAMSSHASVTTLLAKDKKHWWQALHVSLPKSGNVHAGSATMKKDEPRTSRSVPPKVQSDHASQPPVDVNFIPRELRYQPVFTLPRYVMASATAIATALVMICVIYITLLFYQARVEKQRMEIAADIRKISVAASQLEATKSQAIGLQQRLQSIQNLLDHHLHWTTFFALLERSTVSEVAYTNFSMAGTQRVILSATAKDYTSVARQLLAFQQATDFVTAVDVGAITAELDGDGNYKQVSFTMTLTLVSDIFYRNS